MADLSAGRVSMPARIAAIVPERDALLAAMPAYLQSSGALATKLVSLFPRNTDRPTHQAVIVVFDADNGSPLALMDGEAITAARTAAGSALATDLLARTNAQVLAVIGTGVQARAHLRAVPRVREFREIRLAGRHGEKALALLDEARGWLPRARITELKDPFGPATRRKRLDALVVSEETRANGLRVNALRRNQGLKPLRLYVIPMIRTKDGQLLSDTRIRRGEVNPQGRLKVKVSTKIR